MSGTSAGKGRVRLAIRFQKKFVNAVVRNRFKRFIREVFRAGKGGIREGVDLLVIVRHHEGAEKVKFGIVKDKWMDICQKAGILKEKS